MQENFSKKIPKNYFITIIFLTVLIVINIGINESFRFGFLDVIWVGDRDDPNHIGIANSFRFNKTFERSFLGDWIYRSSVDDIINQYDDISLPQSGKGPVFYILLAGFYEILNTTPDNNYYHASILNTIISSIFIILFYFLVKRHFSQKIAILSSFLVILLPLFGFLSIRAIPMLTFFLFSLSSLFFLERSKKHYIIFGLLSGLAHLSHPFGIFLPLTYIVFLLVKKEFKGSLLVFLIYIGTLFPWLIRNYFLFEDIGQGLYIPFSQYISNLFSFLPTNSITYAAIDYLPSTMWSPWPPMESLLGAFYQFDNIFHMGYFIIILIIFTGFTFFRLHRIGKQKIIFLLASFSVIISTYLSIYFFVYNYPIQYFVIFGLPVIIVSLLFVFYRKIFDQSINRYHTFVLLFLFVNMAGYLYSAVFLQRGIPEVRQIFLPLILVTPLVIFSIEKIFYQVKYFSKLKKHHILAAVFITLILLPVFYESVEGITLLSSFPFREKQTNEIKQINSWILENLPKSSHIISNSPSTVSMNTNLKSIHLYPTDYSQENVGKIIDHFKISHLIFYDVENFGSKKLYNSVSESVFFSHRFPEIFSIGNSHILKVEKQSEEYLKEKISEHLTLGKYSQALEVYNAIVGFYDKEIDQLKKSGQLDKANTVQLSLESFTKERDDFVFTVADSNKKIIQKLVESNQYFEVMEVFVKTIDFFEKYTPQPETINQEKKAKIQQLFEEFEIGQHRSLMAWDELLRKEVPILLDSEDDEEAIEFYKSLRDYYQKKYKTFEKSGNLNDAKKIKNSLVEYVGYNARLFMDHEMLYDAERAYLFLLNIDKYDRKVWAEFGELYERMDRLRDALSAYNKANFLPDKDYTDKIEELKNKLES